MAVNYEKAATGRRKKVSAAGKAEARIFEGAYVSPCRWWSCGRSRV